MFKKQKEMLETATGTSEFVIAVCLDIRKFSSFCKKVESLEAALFISKAYVRMVDQAFSDSSYYRLNGDGMIVLYSYNEETLSSVFNTVVSNCLMAMEIFDSICNKVDMINFPLPSEIGIGISRGAASRLSYKSKTLDYFGSPINLASRLSDMAEPSGIVIAGNVKINLLEQKLKNRFASTNVYIKSFAEKEAVEVHYLKKATKIPFHFKRPLVNLEWVDFTKKWKLSEMNKIGTRYAHSLSHVPISNDDVVLTLMYPGSKNGRKLKGYYAEIKSTDFEIYNVGEEYSIRFFFDKIKAQLVKAGVKDDWECSLRVVYQYDPEGIQLKSSTDKTVKKGIVNTDS